MVNLLLIYIYIIIFLFSFFVSPNALIGKNYSLLHDEEPICCEMGPTGICLCLLTLPLGPYTPLGIYKYIYYYF